jgi:hypothetical protein
MPTLSRIGGAILWAIICWTAFKAGGDPTVVGLSEAIYALICVGAVVLFLYLICKEDDREVSSEKKWEARMARQIEEIRKWRNSL